jgi:hypothetical protein
MHILAPFYNYELRQKLTVWAVNDWSSIKRMFAQKPQYLIIYRGGALGVGKMPAFDGFESTIREIRTHGFARCDGDYRIIRPM